MQETQQELKFSNERHTAMAEKYKKDLSDIKSIHAQEKLKLEQALENTKEKYVKELENVRWTWNILFILTILRDAIVIFYLQ